MSSLKDVVTRKLSQIDDLFASIDPDDKLLSNGCMLQIRDHLENIKQTLKSIDSGVDSVSVADRIAEFKDAEIDAMIDEIEATKTDTLDALPNGPAKKIIHQPFVGTIYEDDYSLQMQFWQQYRQKEPTGDIVDTSKIHISEEEIINDPNNHKLFRDYCNLRMDLLYLKHKLPSVYQATRFSKYVQ